MKSKIAGRLFMTILSCLLAARNPISIYAADKEPAKQDRADVSATVILDTCPVFPLMTDGSGTLYYSDYFPSGCMGEIQAGYVYGTFNWPYTACDAAPCIASKKKSGATIVAADWNGMRERVPLTHMHNDNFSCMHTPPATSDKIVAVDSNRPDHFVTFTVNTVRWAKVLEFDITYKNSSNVLTNRTLYVAFEVEPPVNSTYVTQLTEAPVRRDNDFVYRGRTRVSKQNELPPRVEEVLILLQNPSTTIPCPR